MYADPFQNNKVTTLSSVRTVEIQDANGNFKESSTASIFKAKQDAEPAYIKVYLGDIGRLMNLQKGSSALLYELFKLISFDENMIILNAAIKKRIAKTLNIKPQSLNNALSELKKKELLIHVDQGIYAPNPYYFGKGSWAELKKKRGKIECTLEYSDDNERTIKDIKFNFDEFVKTYNEDEES